MCARIDARIVCVCVCVCACVYGVEYFVRSVLQGVSALDSVRTLMANSANYDSSDLSTALLINQDYYEKADGSATLQTRKRREATERSSGTTTAAASNKRASNTGQN